MIDTVMNWFRTPALIVPLSLGFIVLLGCAQSHPITDGFHHSLPATNTRIVIWGNSPVVTGTATTWLLKRGLRLVERSKLLQIFEEQRIRLTHTSDDEGPILRVGKLLGAEIVVFTDASVTSAGYSPGEGFTPMHAAAVSIRGVNVESSEVVFSGTARYPNRLKGNPDDTLAQLTYQALARAWGLRPAGDEAISFQFVPDTEKAKHPATSE